MKVTFIYAYDGEEWSTPLALLKEFENREWDTEIISIGSNRTGKYTDSNLKNWVESNSNTDLVLFLDWGRFDSPYLDKKWKPNAFWVQESGDDPQNWSKNSLKTHKFHFTFTPDYDSYLAYKDMGTVSEWITHFADTNTQYPIDSVDTKYVAVTTRGRGGSQFLDKLTDWGDGVIGNKNQLNSKEHTEFLNSGLMVLQNSRWGEITRRIFEGMACGKLVITDRLHSSKKLDELFIEGKEIIFYDNMVDCINKINYYHENKEERERIAQNGMKRVLDNYTQIQVVDKIINRYETNRYNK
jgi:hypothetical protein